MDGDSRKVVSYSVYGLSLFLLYLFSTLYHAFDGPAKGVFRVLDYQAIYLLIAGTDERTDRIRAVSLIAMGEARVR